MNKLFAAMIIKRAAKRFLERKREGQNGVNKQKQ